MTPKTEAEEAQINSYIFSSSVFKRNSRYTKKTIIFNFVNIHNDFS